MKRPYESTGEFHPHMGPCSNFHRRPREERTEIQVINTNVVRDMNDEEYEKTGWEYRMNENGEVKLTKV